MRCNLITVSTNEHLSIDDRIIYLRNAHLIFQHNKSLVWRRGMSHDESCDVHEWNSFMCNLSDTVEWVARNKDSLKLNITKHLSLQECRVLAFNRGGIKELRRVIKIQRELQNLAPNIHADRIGSMYAENIAACYNPLCDV